MLTIDTHNVLLKPSQKRQLFASLRRTLRLGQRMGNFALNISMQRHGRQYEVRATVHDSAGDFGCHQRDRDWRTALRQLIKRPSILIHDQYLRRAMA